MHPFSQNKKILVVDEEPEMRIFLGHLLEEGGFHPMLATDARDGLQKLMQDPPKVILLAVMLDSEGHLRMFREIKGDERFRHIPVAIISTIKQRHLYQLRILPQLCRSGILPQPEGFLPRPPEAEELLGLVHRLTDSDIL